MRKIGVLTFSDSKNYGALLQAFALREYVADLGFNCNIINYQNPKTKYSQVSLLRRIGSIFAPFLENKIRKRKTAQFRMQNMKMEQKHIGVEDLKSLTDMYDVFIVGSDQVWNPFINRFDSAFFLSFASDKNKRISYAASFGGKKMDKSYLENNLGYLKRFDAISVRESESAELLKAETGIVAETVVDPTFLLTKDDWINKLKLDVTPAKEKYVLCYVMLGNPDLVEKIYQVAKSIADKEHLKIITLGKKSYAKPIGVEILDGTAAPIEFVQYILNAEYVVTNSFHGTAFSIILRKRFFTVLKKGFNLNLRLENLLQSFSLTSRLVYMDSSEENNLLETIDYEATDSKLNTEIEKSKRFLIDAVNG